MRIRALLFTEVIRIPDNGVSDYLLHNSWVNQIARVHTSNSVIESNKLNQTLCAELGDRAFFAIEEESAGIPMSIINNANNQIGDYFDSINR